MVHMYNQIDADELYDILDNRLEDFNIYINQIVKYLNR
ncbi:MAG: HepT-like ribonuclease domain-containing protein [Halanaerobiaceae bacterium]